MADTPTHLYCITDATSDRLYVGITNSPLHRRWRGHCYDATRNDTKLGRAIIALGEASFSIELLHTYPSRQDASDAERELVRQLNLITCGYNSVPGGDDGAQFSGASLRGVPKSPEHRAKIAAALRGKPLSEERRRKIGDANRGKRRSQAVRDAMSVARKGKVAPASLAALAKYWGTAKGPMPDAHKAAISASMKRHMSTPEGRSHHLKMNAAALAKLRGGGG